jgi:hypothetical protein
LRIFLAAIYLCVVLLYTAFTKLSVGLPVRTLVLVLLSVIIFICYFRDSRQFFRKHIEITSVFVALGVIGTILTYWQQGDVVSTLDGLTSNIVQPYLILFSTMMLINIIGLRTVALLSLSGAALSGLVALLQFSNIEIGWRLREIIGEIQHEPAEIQNYVASRSRALGLSLSPIVFSYQIMSAYIALSVMYRFGELRRLLYYGSFFLILIAFLANGTRSAILAIIASEMLMQLRSGRLRSLLPVAAIAAIGAAVYLYAGATGSRIAETEDASALGRMVLYDYGLRLAADHPFGLGWNFDPGGYAWLYWEYLSDYVNADGAFRLGLHNAYLYDPRFVFISLLYLFAYVVHAFFHNNGLFIGDYFYWFSFAVILHIFENNGIAFGATATAPSKPLFALRRRIEFSEHR